MRPPTTRLFRSARGLGTYPPPVRPPRALAGIPGRGAAPDVASVLRTTLLLGREGPEAVAQPTASSPENTNFSSRTHVVLGKGRVQVALHSLVGNAVFRFLCAWGRNCVPCPGEMRAGGAERRGQRRAQRNPRCGCDTVKSCGGGVRLAPWLLPLGEVVWEWLSFAFYCFSL